jgi:outer membrane protein OmpA-like peptidoglycan-associated protein
MIRNIFILFILCFTLQSWAQTKREFLAFGDQAFENEQYESAAYFYSQIIENSSLKKELTYPYQTTFYSPSASKKQADTLSDEIPLRYQKNPYVVHRLADSYRLSHQYKKAEKYYEIAIKLQDEQFADTKLWYASVLMQNDKHDKATQYLEEFLQDNKDSALTIIAKNKLVGCFLLSDPGFLNENVQLQKSDTLLNQGVSSFSVNYFGDEDNFMYASSGKDVIIADPKKQNPQFTADFYRFFTNVDGSRGTPVNMGMPINSDNIEGSGVLSIDKTTFYFTRKSVEIPNDEAIYVSKFFNNQWLQPLKLDEKVNMPGYRSCNPALSLDDSKLFFSSNRPGGFGGMDLWYCDIDEYGNLSEPKNLGPEVNTPGDEVTPFFEFFTNTLYFSSDGHPGIGGLDIFYTNFDEDNNAWTTPKNIGEPFNSSKDDAYFIINKNQTKGYLTSDREPCNCSENDEEYQGTDFCYQIFEFEKPELWFKLKGTVYNAQTEEIIPNALITIKDVKGNKEPVYLTTDENGEFIRDLTAGQLLFIKAQKTKFFGDAATISTLGVVESKMFVQDFYLEPIPAGEIEIPGIEYDFDKATLRPKSKEILDKLVEFLELNDNIVIEIRSHTDERGSAQYNQRLSEERAKSVVDYLVSNGIDPKRLKAVGVGENEPLVKNAKTEEEHQKNRRTAFKTISEDFNNVFKPASP